MHTGEEYNSYFVDWCLAKTAVKEVTDLVSFLAQSLPSHEENSLMII